MLECMQFRYNVYCGAQGYNAQSKLPDLIIQTSKLLLSVSADSQQLPGFDYRQWREKLPQTLLRDRHALLRDLDRLRDQAKKQNNEDPAKGNGNAAATRAEQQGDAAKASQKFEKDRARWWKKCEASSRLREQRAAQLPTPNYEIAASLPVVAMRDEIIDTIRNNQVVILCGETGSGKTTQLPKMCMEAGCGVDGFIGHTQPRSLAARSVAARIAEELGTSVGEGVGFKIRFTDQVSDTSHIKLMTDGILLAEIQNDPFLNQYDTIIVDEAHERSLNIDFLLGCLKRLLPKRPELKVIITSATIDPQSFSRYFDGAPVILAEGRSYPVETRYQPWVEDSSEGDSDNDDSSATEASDMVSAVIDGCETLLAERQGDILVFLSGEREIRELAEGLRKHAGRSKGLRGADVLPLFARLSNAEQNRIFEKHSRPRIVLSTNVAETSLTVPGIRSVIDTGVARISRYSVRGKMQQLPIEKISRASADQRKGRCGREAPGICIRLYDEEDFEARPAFTEPEILRTNLASVILQMASMKLGRIEDFPLIEPPEGKFINDGYRTLQELGALDDKRGLLPLGRQLARLPIDPRLARMLLAARDEGCVDDVLTITSALSVQDPRERPFDKRQQADELHAEFNHEHSDFLAWLALWDFVRVQRKALSGSRFRKMCRQRFLSPVRLFEWMEVRRQLEALCRAMKIRTRAQAPVVGTSKGKQNGQADGRANGKSVKNGKQTATGNNLAGEKQMAKGAGGQALPVAGAEAAYDNIHRALLSGLLVNVAVKTDTHEYLGTRNRRLQIFPGSGLFKAGPKWIMAAEISQTTKVFARQVAKIDPVWVERAASHLLQKTYRDPHWQKKNGHVGAYEQSTLYGLIVNAKKRVNYCPINPQESRTVFIRDGLVPGALSTRGKFLAHNLELIDEVEDLENKSRRRDLMVDPADLAAFYNELLPEDVNSTASFETWRREFEKEAPRGLFYSRDLVLAGESADVTIEQFPEVLDFGNAALPLQYHFSPGAPDDGVTLLAPVNLINRIDAKRCEWLVPGMLEDKVIALIKALPKSLRRNFVPAPDFAKACLEAFADADVPPTAGLLTSLATQLQRLSGVEISARDWVTDSLPDHMLMNFRILGAAGETLREGRNLNELQKAYTGELEEQLLSFRDDSLERDNVTDWNFGDLPETVEVESNGATMRGHPALQMSGNTVGLKLFASADRAEREMRGGLTGLYKCVLHDEIKYLSRKLPGIDTLSLRFAPFGTKNELIDDIINAAVQHTFVDDLPFPRTREAFASQLSAKRKQLVPVATKLCDDLEQIFEAYRQVSKRLDGNLPLSWVEAAADIKDQLARMLFKGFVSDTGAERLPRLSAYFRAITRRLETIDNAPDKDRQRRAELLPVWEQFKQLPANVEDVPDYADNYEALRWSFEELRVSLFAQEVGALEKVSVSRLENRLQSLQQKLP